MYLYEANLPEYSHTMHLHGYSATDVYRAFKKSQRKKHEEKRKKKREQSILEKELYAFMYNSLQACLNEALDDIEKSWK